MKVNEFVGIEKSGAMFAIVSADEVGYLTSQKIILEADRNVVLNKYGDCEVVGFEPKTKRTMYLYVSEK